MFRNDWECSVIKPLPETLKPNNFRNIRSVEHFLKSFIKSFMASNDNFIKENKILPDITIRNFS